MKTDDVQIRGLKQGLSILLGDGPTFEAILHALTSKLAVRANFFRGAQVTVRTGERELTVAEVGQLTHLLQDSFGLVVVAIDSGYPVRETIAAGVMRAEPAEQEGGWTMRPGALVVNRTLRSGSSIRHSGDVIVLGDVNPGAEIVSAGHIVVMGALRGLAHAGCTGDINSIVAAARLQPTQLRIGTVIGRPPDGEPGASAGFHPEVARVVDGAIIVESSSL